MTDELLNDLREASQWLSRPIDGSLVHELVLVVIQLRAVVNDWQSEVKRFKPDLENEVARLTQMIDPLRKKFAKSGKQLRSELGELEKQYLTAKKTVDRQNYRLNDLKSLLSLCADTTSEPQAAKTIRESELDIYIPDRPSGDVGEPWAPITATQLTRLEKDIPHMPHETIYGVYLDRYSDGLCFAFRLLDGRSFALRCFLGLDR